jgi:hypothetical protein
MIQHHFMFVRKAHEAFRRKHHVYQGGFPNPLIKYLLKIFCFGLLHTKMQESGIH